MDKLPRSAADVDRVSDMVSARSLLARFIARVAAIEGEKAELARERDLLRREAGAQDRRLESALAQRARALESEYQLKAQMLASREEELRRAARSLEQKEARARELEGDLKRRLDAAEARQRELEKEAEMKRRELEETKARLQAELTAAVRRYAAPREGS